MSHADIESKLSNLAMLLMMVEPNDNVGISALNDLLDQLLEAALSTGDDRLTAALTNLKKTLAGATGADYLAALSSFVSTAQSYLVNPESTHFNDEQPLTTTQSDFGEYFDPEFLVDFIEKHNLLLDDLEGMLSEFKFSGNNADSTAAGDLNSFVKSYLHNIKGDAGSIGLVGIEKVTHSVEDTLTSTKPCLLLDQLLLYKEWVKSSLSAYAAEKQPQELSTQFLKRFNAACPSGATATEKPQPTPVDLAAVKPMATTEPQPPLIEEYDISGDAELIGEFAAEAEDHLTQVESILLESTGEFSIDDIGKIFRGVHSLKGASSYFNLVEINKTSHILENLLDEVRDGKRQLDQELVQLILSYIDLQKKLLVSAKDAISGTGRIVPSPMTATFLEALGSYCGKTIAPVIAAAPRTETTSTEEPTEAADNSAVARGDTRLNIKTFIKVDTGRLDRLVDAIGEMVIYSSMLVRQCRELLATNEDVLRTSTQVEKFSRELQDIGMSMRLDPIKGLFQKMSRLVWDVSKKLGKQINFQMHGEDTELDRTVIEKLADPLMHMVRNALDHGIESPEERAQKGKPKAGTIELSASHVGGNIVIEIKDDGRGLNPAKLVKKAIEKGLISEQDKLSEQEIFGLIMRPGFSTAEKVTDISGRGVGMDVARSNIESMRGRIRISSEVDKGTTFYIELPLTLAILDGIEITVGKERFIIPTLSVIELISPSDKMITTAVGKVESFCFRGSFLPFYRLANLYKIKTKHTRIEDAVIVIVESAGDRYALMVDGIIGSCQTVIKGLGEMFEENKGLAGCSIMPDGEIGLILDISTLAALAKAEYSWPLQSKEIESLPDSREAEAPATEEIVYH